MTDYLKGNTPATIYKQLLGVGAAADHAGLTASLKQVFTDDGAGGATASSIKISSTAMRVESNNQLRFRDDAIYIYSSGDTILNLVADGEIDLATAAVDINATSTLALDNTNTSNGVVINTATSGSPVSIGHSTSETTINDNLTVTGTTAHTGVVTMATGVKLQFVDGAEYLSGNSSDLTIGASGDINLTASADVNIPADVGLTFGNAGEKIEGDGTDLGIESSGRLNLTGAAASTWKTTAGLINIDSEASTVEIDGHSGVTIQGNSAEIELTTNGDMDLNSGEFTLDGRGVSIDGTEDSNFTVTGSGKDVTVAAVGGGAQTAIFSSAGTGADAVQITSSAGGIDIAGASGGDIDITSTGKSVNITATENAINSINLTTTYGMDINAGTVLTIDSTDTTTLRLAANVSGTKILKLLGSNADGSGQTDIEIDADGDIHLKSNITGAITYMTADNVSSISSAGIHIGTDLSGVDIAIGHTTSDVLVGQNFKVGGTCHIVGDLTVSGSVPASTAITAGTIARLTLTNTDEEDSAGGRDSEILFKGELASNPVHELAAITVSHQGGSTDMHGQMHFRLNDSTSTAALAAVGGADDVLTLTYDKTATFAGAIAAGTNVITGGQVNSDNLRLDGNTISTTDSNGDLIVTPQGTGGVTMMNTNAPGDYAFGAGNAANASGNHSVALGYSTASSGANSIAIGDDTTASAANAIAIGDGAEASAAYGIAIGKSAKADLRAAIAFAAGVFSAKGDTKCCMAHEFDTLTMSGTYQSIDGGTGGITMDPDSVATGTVMVVGSTSGAALTIGYHIHFLIENDGGTEAVVEQSQITKESEDTSFECQITAVSDKFVVQVRDAAVTSSMKWTCFWQWAQQTF